MHNKKLIEKNKNLYIKPKLRYKQIKIKNTSEVKMALLTEGRGIYKKLLSKSIRERVKDCVSSDPGGTVGYYCKKIGICQATFSKHFKELVLSGDLKED